MEVEVVSSSSSSSPFGCVLKDHNLRDRSPTTSKGQPTLQKTLKELVRERLRSSINPKSSNENSNSNHPPTSRPPALPLPRYKTKAVVTKEEISSKAGDSIREPSPALSDSSISGLVQKWRVLETSDHKQVPIQDSTGSDYESVSDWESDQAPPSECLVPDGDKEKIRVVDIIRRLPFAVSLNLKELRGGMMPESGDGAALFSPRIRGRQAVSDLLGRLARDRYDEVEALAELSAVSKFPKRGRIQSLLKIRLLTREASAHHYRHYQEPRVYVPSKSTRQRLSSVKSLRRRFNTAAAEQNGSDSTASGKMEDSISNMALEKAFASEQPLDTAGASNDNRGEEISLGRISDETPEQNDLENIVSRKTETTSNNLAVEKAFASEQPSEASSDNCQEEISDETDPEPTHQEKNCIDRLNKAETTDTEVKLLDERVVNSESENRQTEEKENLETASNSASTEMVQKDMALLQADTEDLPQELASLDVILQESGSDEEGTDYGSPGMTDTLSHNAWEEEEEDEEEMFENEEFYDDDGVFESSLDWIHDISRPRSYWESRRRSWYEEILESSANNDIRQLIERGSVSAVLTSDFRDRMDQLMMSSVRLQMDPIAREDEERPVCRGSVSAVLTSDFRDRMDQLMISRVQLQMDPLAREDEEQRPMVAVLHRQMQSLSGMEEEEDEQKQDQEHCLVEEQVVIHGQESREVETIREDAIREEDMDGNEDIEEEDEEESVREEAIREEDMDENVDIEEEDEEQILSYYREQTPLLEVPWSSYQDQENSDDLEEEIESATHRQDSFISNSFDYGSQEGEQIVIHGQESREVEPIREDAIREEDMDGNEDIEEEDEEERSSYYREQTPSLDLPWSSYQEQEDSDGDGLEQIESATHRQESFITSSYDRDSQVGPSVKNGSTMEMEVIYDIRAHMQQMYREMSELRKAVSSCVDMQSKFQSSIREEVSAAISNLDLGKTKGKESKRMARKGSCCICREKKADSLLYRCGHMCTCFECGNELQWSSGKCPICWAHIADVVRVCTDYY